MKDFNSLLDYAISYLQDASGIYWAEKRQADAKLEKLDTIINELEQMKEN